MTNQNLNTIILESISGFKLRETCLYHVKLKTLNVAVGHIAFTFEDRYGTSLYLTSLYPKKAFVWKENLCYIIFSDRRNKFISPIYNTTDNLLISKSHTEFRFDIITLQI